MVEAILSPSENIAFEGGPMNTMSLAASCLQIYRNYKTCTKYEKKDFR